MGLSQSRWEDLVKLNRVIWCITQAGSYICLCLLSQLLLLKLGCFGLEAHCIFLNKHILTAKDCLKEGRNTATLAMTISSDLKDKHYSKCFTTFLKHLIRSGFTEAKVLRFASLHCLKLTLQTLYHIISILSLNHSRFCSRITQQYAQLLIQTPSDSIIYFMWALSFNKSCLFLLSGSL